MILTGTSDIPVGAGCELPGPDSLLLSKPRWLRPVTIAAGVCAGSCPSRQCAESVGRRFRLRTTNRSQGEPQSVINDGQV